MAGPREVSELEVRERPPSTLRNVAAPELGGPQDTWQRRSSPQQEGEVQGRGTCGGAGAHLCREVWSEVTAYVTARGCTPYYLS
jgi:hypothetical protein